MVFCTHGILPIMAYWNATFDPWVFEVEFFPGSADRYDLFEPPSFLLAFLLFLLAFFVLAFSSASTLRFKPSI